MDDLEQLKELVLHYLRGIWKNRWIAIAIAWPLLIAGVVAVDQIKDRYTAETKVYIDSASLLKPLLRGLAIETDFQASVRLMVKKLLSRPNLERAARIMDMDIDVQTPAEMEALIQKIRARTKINARGRTSTYTISYSDESRDRAKKMVQTLLDIFVEDSLGKSSTESDTAISFLDSQIQRYDILLQEAEERLEDFKRENVGLMPKDGANYYGQLQEVNVQLEQANRLLAEATNRRNKLESQLNNMVIEKQTVFFTSSYEERIRAQELKLEDLLLQYTTEHPDVINAQFVLDSLKKRHEQEMESLQQQAPVTITDNPVQQELQILLTQTEADISSLRARVSSFKTKQDEVKKLVDIVPKIEAELQRLNRDYEIHRKNYNELVQRRETARISEDVESGTEQVKFRIIEPPFVPLKPDYPNRPLYDAAVLVVALGIGYGISLLISLFQPVFYNQTELRNFFDYAVLGAVSKFDTAKVLSKRRRNLFLFSVANIFLISVAVGFMVIHKQGILLTSMIKPVS